MRTIVAALSLVTITACAEDTGSITATVYGEAFIEEGIPAAEVIDGWAISFDKFLVSIGKVSAQAGHDRDPVGFDTFHVVDLALPSNEQGYELGTFDAPGGTYDHYGYQLQPDPSATNVNAADADYAAFTASGNTIWVVGSATKGGVTKTFDWSFDMKLSHQHCEAGVTIDGDNVVMQSTIHSDHFFYDDAVSDEPNVAFDIFAAADGNADHAITLEELSVKDIRAETRYQVGSTKDLDGKEITNMLQYLELQATTLGHINGEGHCEDSVATR